MSKDKPIKLGYLRFKDFVCESFKPKNVNFGYDLNNKEFIILDNDLICTYFKSSENQIYAVMFRNGHFGFALYVGREEFNPENIKIAQDISKYFTMRPRASGNALRIFNEIIFIVVNFVKDYNIDELYFNGSNEDLKKLYGLMVRDKTFLKVLDSIGYFYSGFEKVDNMFVHVIKKL